MADTHTPGPWTFDGPSHNIIVHAPDGNRICFMTSDGPAEANARLIAASPDLLAALRAILENDGATASKQYHAMKWGEAREAGFVAIARVEGLAIAEPVTDRERIASALDILIRYGQIDGAHHKLWVIDQAVRALTGDDYARVIAEANAGEDGPETYGWDEGIAP